MWLKTLKGYVRPSAVEYVGISKQDYGKYVVYVRTISDTKYVIAYCNTFEEAEEKREEIYQVLIEYDKEHLALTIEATH